MIILRNVGDEIYIHHNIFRRYYDIRGNEKNSGSFFKDNLFFCEHHQIYLYSVELYINY